MGDVKRILGQSTLSDPLYKNIRIEQAEKIHIHWKDARLICDEHQFKTFIEAIKESDEKWNGDLSPGKDIVLKNTEPVEELYNDASPDAAIIEELQDGNIHTHIREFRLELTPQNFLKIAIAMQEAVTCYLHKAKIDTNKCSLIWLPIKDVNPYDGRHPSDPDKWENKEDFKDHVHYAEKLARILKENPSAILLPPAIRKTKNNHEFLNKPYERLDGWKRWRALSLAGYDSYWFLLFPGNNGFPGCQQHCDTWLVEPENWEERQRLNAPEEPVKDDRVNYVCKMCGRTVRSKEKPNYCYFDLSDQVENISDEDSIKMGLFSRTDGIEFNGYKFEFPMDIKFDPMTGEKINQDIVIAAFKKSSDIISTLDEFQNAVFKEMICKK